MLYGVVPDAERSGKRESAVAPQGHFLRGALTRQFLARMPKNQYLQLIARGKTKMAALDAAMRKMVHICFGVLKHQQPFHS